MKTNNNWWADKTIRTIEIDDIEYALNGWNGERYNDCWAFDGTEITGEGIVIEPIYNFEGDEDTNPDFGQIINYKIV